MTADEMRDALVESFHERMHEDECRCPALFIAAPVDALIAAARAPLEAEVARLRRVLDVRAIAHAVEVALAHEDELHDDDCGCVHVARAILAALAPEDDR